MPGDDDRVDHSVMDRPETKAWLDSLPTAKCGKQVATRVGLGPALCDLSPFHGGECKSEHEHCEYFVLDWAHDPFAIPAARAYANACEAKYPALAEDLRAKASNAEQLLSPGRERKP